MKHLLRSLDYLRVLANSSTLQRKAIIKVCSDQVLDSIFEIALNLLKSNIPLTSAEKKKLKAHKSSLILLADKTVSRNRKRALLTHPVDGQFLTHLLKPAIKLLEAAS